MITGILLNETVDFISKFDKGAVKTIWKIKPLDSENYLRITKKMNTTDESIAAIFEVAKLGIAGVTNFKDKNGKDIIFSDVIIEAIPRKIAVELGTEILKLSELSEEEIKN